MDLSLCVYAVDEFSTERRLLFAYYCLLEIISLIHKYISGFRLSSTI